MRQLLIDFVNLVFEHPAITPTRSEYAMFQAHGAALRSSASRQVGASILDKYGDIVTAGCNEVAKANGGQYWHGEQPDHRDFKNPDRSGEISTELLADLIARLKFKHWLVAEKSSQSTEKLVDVAKGELLPRLTTFGDKNSERESLAQRALVSNIIECLRAVHAEMACVTSAARRGVSVEGGVLYSTTFPCHECAKLIVAAGITRVEFIEPYPKSRVVQLYGDSISIDEFRSEHIVFQAFLGVGPRKYSMFLMTERLSVEKWEENKAEQNPRDANPIQSYLSRETEDVAILSSYLTANSLIEASSSQVAV